MYILNIFYLSYPLLLYLICCIIFIFYNDMIYKYYSYVSNNISWIILNIGIFIISYIFINKYFLFYLIYSFYLLNTYIIYKIGNNKQYFIIGILISLLQSELWEYPMFIIKGFINIPPFFIFAYIIFTLKYFDFDTVSFTRKTMIFFIIYCLFVFIVIPSTLNKYTYLYVHFILRLICSLFFINLVNNIHKKTYKCENMLMV